MAHLPSAGGPTPLSLRSYHPLSPSAAHDGTLLLLIGDRASKGRGVSSASWVRGPAISRDSASLGRSPIAKPVLGRRDAGAQLPRRCSSASTRGTSRTAPGAMGGRYSAG